MDNLYFSKIQIEMRFLGWPLELYLKSTSIDKHLKKITSEGLIRIPNSPISILELNQSFIENISILSTYITLTTEEYLSKTQFFRFFRSRGFPIPKSVFCSEFDYPISIICHLNNQSYEPEMVDFSNYLNLDYLKIKDLTLAEAFKEPGDFNQNQKFSPQILFAEYLHLPT